MHMILTLLSAIYHGPVPILQYNQRHADQLSNMHIWYVFTREMTPWIDRLPTYLADPLHNEDPEPYSKQYSAGRTELVEHNLAKNLKKRKKHNTPGHEPPP